MYICRINDIFLFFSDREISCEKVKLRCFPSDRQAMLFSFYLNENMAQSIII